jgi:hypothetical protein
VVVCWPRDVDAEPQHLATIFFPKCHLIGTPAVLAGEDPDRANLVIRKSLSQPI